MRERERRERMCVFASNKNNLSADDVFTVRGRIAATALMEKRKKKKELKILNLGKNKISCQKTSRVFFWFTPTSLDSVQLSRLSSPLFCFGTLLPQ